jgi:hypothetical protein
MNPPVVQTSHAVQFAVPLILVAGIVLLYCIRKRLVPQLLFLMVFVAAALTLVYAFAAGSTWLIVVGLVIVLAAGAGFTRAYNRRPAAAV